MPFAVPTIKELAKQTAINLLANLRAREIVKIDADVIHFAVNSVGVAANLNATELDDLETVTLRYVVELA